MTVVVTVVVTVAVTVVVTVAVTVAVLISVSCWVPFSEHATKREERTIVIAIVTQSGFCMRCMFSLLIRSIWQDYDNRSLWL